MTKIAAVLFDLDGTLIDSNELHVSAWHEVFADAGHDVPKDRLRGQIGKGGDKFVPAVLPDVPQDEQEALSDAHGKLFKSRYIVRARPFPGARVLLARLADEGVKVVLATSASREELDHYVALLDAASLIAASTTIDDVAQSKPAPDIFAAASKKSGVAANAAVAVGDSPFDMESARKADITPIGLRSGGFDDEALTEAGAVALYDDVAELLARLDSSLLAPR